MRRTGRLVLGLTVLSGALTRIPAWSAADGDVLVGERPAIQVHLDEGKIEPGEVTLKECLERGRTLFEAVFNKLDGQGRPLSTGGGAPRIAGQPAPPRAARVEVAELS